jgi:hypothetical protein
VAGGEGGAERLGLRLGRGIGEACGRRGVEEEKEERMLKEGMGGPGSRGGGELRERGISAGENSWGVGSRARTEELREAWDLRGAAGELQELRDLGEREFQRVGDLGGSPPNEMFGGRRKRDPVGHAVRAGDSGPTITQPCAGELRMRERTAHIVAMSPTRGLTWANALGFPGLR